MRTIGRSWSSRAARPTSTRSSCPSTGARLSALRLETLPDDSLPAKGPGHARPATSSSRGCAATVTPPGGRRPAGRYVRIELPGKEKILSLAEVQVFRGTDNVARRGEATQSSTAFDGPAKLAIDGNTDGRYDEAKSTTHTDVSDDPWWEVDLKTEQADRPHRRLEPDRQRPAQRGSAASASSCSTRSASRSGRRRSRGRPSRAPSSRSAAPRPIAFAAAFADYSQPRSRRPTSWTTRTWPTRLGRRRPAGQAARADARPGDARRRSSRARR